MVPLSAGADPGPRSRLHLRRRRLRGRADLRRRCRSASTSISRGSRAAWTRSASPNPFTTDGMEGVGSRRWCSAYEASHGVARPVRLHAGHARRREAGARVPEGRRADGVHDDEPAGAAAGRASREHGVAAVTQPDNRWLRCDIKSVSLLGNVLMAENAAAHGATETIMFRDGFLTEGSSSNVWVVRRRRAARAAEGQPHPRRHPLRADRRARRARTACRFEVGPIAEADVRSADELMLSSATKEVVPVVTLDGAPVGDGRVGPVYRQLHAWYQDAKAAARAAPDGSPWPISTASSSIRSSSRSR